MTNKVYLFQSTDCLLDTAIQNAIIVAQNKKAAIKKFRHLLSTNEECKQFYRPEWFECQRIDLTEPQELIQFGGDTWQFA